MANPVPKPLDLGVARSRIRTSEGPLVELADRVNYLRHAAWAQSQTDKPSAQILRNLAAIGATLNTAAAHTNRAAATLTQPGPDREAHQQTADQAMRAGDAWRSIGESIAYLRTPTPSMPAIELAHADQQPHPHRDRRHPVRWGDPENVSDPELPLLGPFDTQLPRSESPTPTLAIKPLAADGREPGAQPMRGESYSP